MITRQIVMLSIIVLLMASAATLGQAQGNVIWSKWTDPEEIAFSLEVPQGWHVEGGLIRNPQNPAVDYRPYIRVTSPNGTIIITRWDYRFPNVYATKQLSGLDFAEWYLSHYPEAGCTGITITSRDNRGRVDYRCYKNGILMAGAIAAQTAPIGSGWTLRDLQSYLAPASQAKIAESLLSHMVETSYWNPSWTARNAQWGEPVSSPLEEHVAVGPYNVSFSMQTSSPYIISLTQPTQDSNQLRINIVSMSKHNDANIIVGPLEGWADISAERARNLVEYALRGSQNLTPNEIQYSNRVIDGQQAVLGASTHSNSPVFQAVYFKKVQDSGYVMVWSQSLFPWNDGTETLLNSLKVDYDPTEQYGTPIGATSPYGTSSGATSPYGTPQESSAYNAKGS